jgi:hypothetical protein
LHLTLSAAHMPDHLRRHNACAAIVLLRVLERPLRMTAYVDSHRMFVYPLCSLRHQLQHFWRQSGLALPHQILGYNPELLSDIKMLQHTLAIDVALCGKTKSAVVVAWAPTSSWQISKRVSYRAGGSTLYIHKSPLRQSKDYGSKIERAGTFCI